LYEDLPEPEKNQKIQEIIKNTIDDPNNKGKIKSGGRNKKTRKSRKQRKSRKNKNSRKQQKFSK
jgi:hypothetical protein